MAKNRSFFKSLFTLIVLAAIAFAVVYFFFPEQSEKYFSISWASRPGGAEAEMDEAVEEVLTSISGAMEEAGATKEEVETALSTISIEDLKEAIELAWTEGKDAVEIFVDSIGDKIDFGSIDLDIVKEGIMDNLRNIDFSNAMNVMRDNLDKGLKNLAEAVKDVIN